ncbi:MAG: RNA polymerase sigma factor, partial [Pirellulaceae bacterium]
QLLLTRYDELQRHVAARLPAELRDVWPVEDVLQETFYKAAQSIRSFEHRGPGSFLAWLKTIASNRIKDAHKRRRRERRASPLAALADSTMTQLVQRLAGDSPSPSQHVRQQDRVRLLRSALASLPAEQQEVIVRYYLQEQSLDQIADALARTKDAVRGICYRAKQNLRSSLGHSSQFLSR